MPIDVHLDLLLVQRKITLTELAERVGITLANLSILKTGKARAIRFSTLEALCRELHCQPGDLLGYREHNDSDPASTADPAPQPELTSTGGRAVDSRC